MQFQVKDLIIVLPEEEGENLLAGCTVSCTPYGCTRPDSRRCDPGTCKITVCNEPTLLPTRPTTPFLEYADQLALLKDQLQVQMQMIEQQEQLLRQQAGPQSVAEVEKVEQALRGALD
ncbi:MAG TPA: hypothetical protein VF414_10430, partial [Thermoanaerobaculia bacterium]